MALKKSLNREKRCDLGHYHTNIILVPRNKEQQQKQTHCVARVPEEDKVGGWGAGAVLIKKRGLVVYRIDFYQLS